MKKKIRFQKNAEVLNEKGDSIGLLERVVLNPQTKVVTDLVVRTGSLFNRKEKVVPMELVTATSESLVVLRDDDGRLDALPLFEEERIVSDADDTNPSSSEGLPPVIYGPPSGTPLVVPTQGERYTTMIAQNIPDGTVAMKEGANVIAAEGKHVGRVESVFADPAVDQVTHLLISSGMFMKELKIIPIQWVGLFGEDEVHLSVRKASVEAMADIAGPD